MRFVPGISVFLLLSPIPFLFSCGGSAWFGQANRPPVADAGPDMIVYQGQPFRLDGTHSADPDGPIASYRWVQTAGKDAGGSFLMGKSPEVVAPFVGPAGEELRFQLTVTDAGGLSAMDSVSVKVKKYLFYEDFLQDTTKNYAARDVKQNGNTGQFRYIEPLKNVHAIPGPGSGLKFSHDVPAVDNGTFSFVFTLSRSRQQEGRIRIFLMEDNNRYYELYSGVEKGGCGFRKVVNGKEVDSSRLKNGYSSNVPYAVRIIFSPESTTVDAFDELVVLNKDREHILVKRFEIHTEGQEAYYDNIVLTQDPFVKAFMPHRIGLWDSNVTVKAIPGLMRKGWKIRFIMDQATGNQVLVDINEKPFETTFGKVTLSPHTLDAYILDGSGVDALAHDQIKFTARDGYYVAVGDSITEGTGDNSGMADDALPSGTKRRWGYEPVLEKLLESAKGYPHTVVNQGNSGSTSADGLKLMPTVLKVHPEANYFLILYGTNDSSIPVPSGKGLHPGDPGYRGSFKDNMQQMISLIVGDRKTPILAKVPVVFDSFGGKKSYRNPDRTPRNALIREYNVVIDELNAANGIPVSSPDFYSHFRKNPKELSDGIHPNGRGYRSMAKLWFGVLAKAEKSLTVREPFAKKEPKLILLEKPSPPKKATNEAAAPPPPRSGTFLVQVAAFRNPESAKSLRKGLLKDGFHAVVQTGTKYHKVFVGPYPDKGAATQAIRKIKAERNLDPFLVRR